MRGNAAAHFLYDLQHYLSAGGLAAVKQQLLRIMRVRRVVIYANINFTDKSRRQHMRLGNIDRHSSAVLKAVGNIVLNILHIFRRYIRIVIECGFFPHSAQRRAQSGRSSKRISVRADMR